jgi:hypothetical protein
MDKLTGNFKSNQINRFERDRLHFSDLSTRQFLKVEVETRDLIYKYNITELGDVEKELKEKENTTFDSLCFPFVDFLLLLFFPLAIDWCHRKVI